MRLSSRILASQSSAVSNAMALLFAETLTRRQPADRALHSYLRQHREFGSRDRRLIGETVYAAFRWWGWLRGLAPGSADAAATGEAPSGAGEDSPAAWETLLLGARLLEGLPPDELMEFWAGRHGLDPLALTSVSSAGLPAERARRFHELLAGIAGAAPDVRALMPDWVLAETDCPLPPEEWIPWFQRRPPLWLRIQRPDREAVLRALEEAGLAPAPEPRLPNAVRLARASVALDTLPAYREGALEVQDLASQAVGFLCAPAAGGQWWDACAGGGGKSLALASLMSGSGTVVASDIREHKLEELRSRARRAGFSNIRTRPWDGGDNPPARAAFDGVLVDAPCTGSGTWRRNPAARWSTPSSDIADKATAQARLLRGASAGVRPGGLLVYSTCSLFRRENELAIRSFLAEHSDFRLEPFRHPLTQAPTPGHAQIWPWEGDCDAMFVARLRKTASS